MLGPILLFWLCKQTVGDPSTSRSIHLAMIDVSGTVRKSLNYLVPGFLAMGIIVNCFNELDFRHILELNIVPTNIKCDHHIVKQSKLCNLGLLQSGVHSIHAART